MFFRTVHMPTVYTPPCEADSSNYCTILLQILEGLLSNGLILVDDMGQIRQTIINAVQNWPPAHRKKCEEVLIQLDKRNRLVGLPASGNSVQLTCPELSCRLAIEIANGERPDRCLVKPHCTDCKVLPNAVDPQSYAITGSLSAALTKGSVVLSNGEWTKNLFEANVLHPVFHCAKHVKIIDRWVGRSITWDKQESAFKIAKNYERTLRWMLELFGATRANRFTTGVEVLCGLQASRLKGQDVNGAAYALKHWAADLADEFGYPIEMHVKLERTAHEMRHDRYLITDQIAIYIGRGADLLGDDEKSVRDVTLGIVGDPGKIETEVNCLPEIA